MKTAQIIYIFVIIALVNCETITLHRKIRKHRHHLNHSINLLKVKHSMKTKAELQELADSIKQYGADFVKGFVLELVEKATGVDSNKVISDISGGCAGFDDIMGSLVTDTQPDEKEKAVLDKDPQLNGFSTCRKLSMQGGKSFYLEPLKFEDFGPATKVGEEQKKDQKMDFKSWKDRNNFIHYFSFLHYTTITGWWFEIVNTQTQMRLSAEGADQFINHVEQKHGILGQNTKVQNWECIENADKTFSFKNEEKQEYMAVDGEMNFIHTKTLDDNAKFKAWRTPEMSADESAQTQNYGKKVQSWFAANKPKIDCAIEKVTATSPDNVINVAIRNIIMLQVGKVIAHILLGVFTLGIGNAILEFASWTATMIQGGIALIYTTQFFIKTIKNLLDGSNLQAEVVNLGRCVPQFFQAILKFLGSGGRRLALQRKMKSNMTKIAKAMKHKHH